jgi:hypothetical protein
MLKIVAYVCIGFCVLVIAYAIRVYLESPKMKRDPEKEEKDNCHC